MVDMALADFFHKRNSQLKYELFSVRYNVPDAFLCFGNHKKDFKRNIPLYTDTLFNKRCVRCDCFSVQRFKLCSDLDCHYNSFIGYTCIGEIRLKIQILNISYTENKLKSKRQRLETGAFFVSILRRWHLSESLKSTSPLHLWLRDPGITRT